MVGAILTSLCDLAGSATLAALLVVGGEYLAPSGFVFGLLFIVTSGLLIYGVPRESSAVILFWMTFKVSQEQWCQGVDIGANIYLTTL